MSPKNIVRTYFHVHHFINNLGCRVNLNENELRTLLDLKDIKSITIRQVVDVPITVISGESKIKDFLESVKNSRPLDKFLKR